MPVARLVRALGEGRLLASASTRPTGRLPSPSRRLDNLGGHSGGETPLPIPNREVKPASADGTRGASPRESRTPPTSLAGEPMVPPPAPTLERVGTHGSPACPPSAQLPDGRTWTPAGQSPAPPATGGVPSSARSVSAREFPRVPFVQGGAATNRVRAPARPRSPAPPATRSAAIGPEIEIGPARRLSSGRS